jgi:positive regulator of sigma E activity
MPSHEQLTVSANGSFPIGSAVTVTLPERFVLVGALALYGLPLAALLAGGAVASRAFGSDLAAAAGATAALIGALVAASPLRGRLERATLRRLTVDARL